MLKKHIPALFPLVFISLGIVCEESIRGNFYISIFTIWSFFIMTIPLQVITLKSRFNFLTLSILLFITGVLISQSNQTSDLHFSIDAPLQQLIIQVYKIETTKRGFKIFSKVRGSKNNDQKKRHFGRLIIYTAAADQIKLYDQYQIPANFRKIEKFGQICKFAQLEFA